MVANSNLVFTAGRQTAVSHSPGEQPGIPEALSEFCGCFHRDQLLKKLSDCIRRRCDLALTVFSLQIIDSTIGAEEKPDEVNSIRIMVDHCNCILEFSDRHNTRCRLELQLRLKHGNPQDFQRNLQMLQDGLAEEIEIQREGFAIKRRDLLSKMIHQVRNPLATILISSSQISLKEDARLDDDDRMLMNFISSEAERIEDMLNKYAKFVHAGKLHLEEVGIDELMNLFEADSQLRDAFEFEFTNDLDPHENNSSLLVDKDKLNEAIQQLLENGVEAVAGGCGKMELKLSRDKSKVQIKVCDKGPGIRPELLRKVKEPFYSTKDGGSGLGLAIASLIAAGHGGKLSLNSNESGQTEAVLEIPCK